MMSFDCLIPCFRPLPIKRQLLKLMRERTAAKWSKVHFSEESKCCVTFGNQGHSVWRRSEVAKKLFDIQRELSTTTDVRARWSDGISWLCLTKSKVLADVNECISTRIWHLPLLWFHHYGNAVSDWPANWPDIINIIQNLI